MDAVWKVSATELSSMGNLGTVISLQIQRKCAKSLVINSTSCRDVAADFRWNANISCNHLFRFDKRKIHNQMTLDFCHKQFCINNSELRIDGHIEIQMRTWELLGWSKCSDVPRPLTQSILWIHCLCISSLTLK